jgi:hypothetical protein
VTNQRRMNGRVGRATVRRGFLKAAGVMSELESEEIAVRSKAQAR